MSCIGWIQAGDVWALHVPLFHVCSKSACCSCVRCGWPAQFAVRFLTILWFPFLLWFAPLRGWALLNGGLCLPLVHFFGYHFLPCHSIIPVAKLFVPILLGLFGLAVYSSPNDPVRPLILLLHHWRAPVSHLFSLGCPWPICFPWAFLALFLTLHSHGLLLSSLGFPGLITLSLILGAHRLAINLLLSLLLLLWACRGPFSLFHIIYCLWFSFFFFLFPGPFKPICLLKTHLFILWACDPLFLPLGLNEFSIHLLTLFCLHCWASPFHLDFQNGHQQWAMKVKHFIPTKHTHTHTHTQSTLV